MARPDRKDRGLFTYRNVKGLELYGVRLAHRGRDLRIRLGTPDKTFARQFYEQAKREQRLARFFPEQYQASTGPKLLHGTTDDPLLKEYATTWLRDKETQGLKHTTAASYELNLRLYILPALGAYPLGSLTRALVKGLAATMKTTGASTAKIRSVLATLSSLFSDAIEDEYVGHNPCLRPSKFLTTAPQDEIEILTPSEEATLLTTAREVSIHGNPPGVWYPLIVFLLRTGVRIGEALSVKVADLDWHGRFVKIQRSFTRGQVTNTKGRRSRRVDLSPRTLVELQRQVSRIAAERLKRGWPETPWLFPNGAGELKPYRNFIRDCWEPLLLKAKLRAITPHVLRHTWVSRLIAAGAPLPYISRQAGHSSIKVTVDRYGHLLPDEGRGFMDGLDDDASQGPPRLKKRVK